MHASLPLRCRITPHHSTVLVPRCCTTVAKSHTDNEIYSMGTAGTPGGFDIQNFFRSAPQSPLHGFTSSSPPYPQPNHPFQPPSHPFPANHYPSSTSAFPSLAGSYSYPQGSVYNSYMQYSQDYGSLPPSYPSPTFSQPGVSQPMPTPPPSLSHSASLSQLNIQTQSHILSPPLDGARLMALLTSHSSGDLITKDESSMASLLAPPNSLELPPPALGMSEVFEGNSELSNPPAAIVPTIPSAPPVSLALSPVAGSRSTIRKFPRGRNLKGEHVVYDIDLHLPGEAQPQLEVSPITVYGSDPVLVVGRQIAVNRSYICYGLRAGTIRILNINTALRNLLRGHSQRVTDMAFFAEDVHLLASASADGRVFIRRIMEGLSEDGKLQITEQIMLAIQIVGDWELVHPRVCWHSQIQDLLVVGVGNYVLTIDVPTVRMAAAPNGFTVDDPLKCHVKNPIAGVYCVGGHDAEITDLSTSQWTCLASASKDGMVRIWGDKKMFPTSSLNPHEGRPVGSVAFLSAPHCLDHKVLLTTGPLNEELKLWVPAGNEGWFPQSGNVRWQCIQTLKLESSAEEKVEDAFFNQVLVVPHACLILLANAKRNAIYVVHVEFGSSPSATRMDYLAEFSVTIPILSLTATSENVIDGEGVLQVYCVQTQAIQQYSLDLSQCVPPPIEESHPVPLYNIERKISCSQICDRSLSATPPPTEATSTAFEASNVVLGGRLNSPALGARVKSPGPIPGSGKSTFVVSAVELPCSRDQIPAMSMESTVMLDSKSVMSSATKEVKEILAKENVPSILDIAAPAHAGPVLVSPTGSPLGRRSRSPAFGSPPVDQAEKLFHVQEQYAQERAEDTGKLDPFPLSPRRMYDDSLRLEEDNREWQVSSPGSHASSMAVEQQASSGPVHLVTPSELMSMVARSKAEADLGATISPRASILTKDFSKGDIELEEGSSEIEILTLETKEMAEKSVLSSEDTRSMIDAIVEDIKDRSQTGAISDSESSKEFNIRQSLLVDQAGCDEVQQCDQEEASEEKDCSLTLQVDVVQEQLKDMSLKASHSQFVPVLSQLTAVAKGRKNKNKNNAAGSSAQVSTISSISQVSSTSATSVTSYDGESSNGNNVRISTNMVTQILAMQDSLNQLVAMQKELQKQMTVMVAVPVAKEGKRMEAALGQRMEKVLKAHVDAMWARIQEENLKREKVERERLQQFSILLSNFINKDLPVTLERLLKKEISLIGPAVTRLITPSIEKTIPTAVNETFQKGISEKGVIQLEKSVGAKLEAAVLRQLQSNFQTTGRQTLQEALRSCFEGSVIPAFERSCKVMFEQVDVAFQKGMAEHTTYAQQQFASHSVLASTLQDTVTSASSLAASLKGELADGQRKLLALAESAGGARISSSVGLPDKVVTLQHVEESLDPTIELSRLVGERKLEEAFNKALSRSNVAVVSWLCTQVDPGVLFRTVPLPLSQGVLLSLVQQLGCDLGKDTARKLTWIREAAVALNPNDPLLAPHMRPFLEQLYQNLHRQMLLTNVSGELASSMRLVIHVVNSLLTACK